MHLQKAIDYDVFARSLSIGAETMVMRFRPELPMHERYAVDHAFLSAAAGRRGRHHRQARQRVLPVGVQLVRDAGGRRRGLPDRLRQRLPGRVAHQPALLLPVGHQGAGQVEHLRAGDRPPATARPERPGSTSRSRTTRRCPTPTSWPPTASWPTATSRPSTTRTSARQPLPDLDAIVLDWVAGPDFDRLLVETVRSVYPPARARPVHRAPARPARHVGQRRERKAGGSLMGRGHRGHHDHWRGPAQVPG